MEPGVRQVGSLGAQASGQSLAQSGSLCRTGTSAGQGGKGCPRALALQRDSGLTKPGAPGRFACAPPAITQLPAAQVPQMHQPGAGGESPGSELGGRSRQNKRHVLAPAFRRGPVGGTAHRVGGGMAGKRPSCARWGPQQGHPSGAGQQAQGQWGSGMGRGFTGLGTGLRREGVATLCASILPLLVARLSL